MQHTDPRVVIVVPARMESKRFPGKPLAKLDDRELLLHVWDAVRQVRRLTIRRFVVTDSPRISAFCRQNGIPVVCREKDFHNGCERVAEIIQDLDIKCDIVLSVPCNQPDLTKQDLQALIAYMTPAERREGTGPEVCSVATLYAVPVFAARLTPAALKASSWPEVRVVTSNSGKALYFSREAIPGSQHVGVYAFRASTLAECFGNLNQAGIEIDEDLEQLRLLAHEYQVQVLATPVARPMLSINTPADVVDWREQHKLSRQQDEHRGPGVN